MFSDKQGFNNCTLKESKEMQHNVPMCMNVPALCVSHAASGPLCSRSLVTRKPGQSLSRVLVRDEMSSLSLDESAHREPHMLRKFHEALGGAQCCDHTVPWTLFEIKVSRIDAQSPQMVGDSRDLRGLSPQPHQFAATRS